MKGAFIYLESIKKDEKNWEYFNRFLLSYLKSRGHDRGAHHGAVVAAKILAHKSGLELCEVRDFEVMIEDEIEGLVLRKKGSWTEYIKAITKFQPYHQQAVELSPYHGELFMNLNKKTGKLSFYGVDKKVNARA